MFEKLKNLVKKNNNDNFIPFNENSGGLFGLEYSNKAVRTLSRTDYLNLYTGWVYFCVTRIAQTLSALEYHVINDKKEIINSDKTDLINSEFIESVISYILLTGGVYIKKVKIGNNVKELEILRPDRVVKTQGNKYKYHNEVGKLITVSGDDIIDIQLFSPYGHAGVSPVQAIASQISTDIATQNWDWKFFENGATPSGLFTVQHDASDAALDRFKTDWKNKYSGVKNSHKTAVLPYGMDYKTITPSQKEMDFVDKRRFTKEEIFTIFGIPEALFDKNSNLATAKVAEKNFMKFTILPLATKLSEALTREIFNEGIFKFINIVPTDTAELTNLYISGAITLNEYRQAMNYKPFKNGDFVRSAFGELDIELEPLENEKKTAQITKKELKNTQNLEKAVKQAIRGTEEWAEYEYTKKIKRLDENEKEYAKVFEKIFDIQKNDILKELSNKKSYKVKKWDKTKYIGLYIALLEPVQEDLFIKEGTAALGLAGIDEFFQVDESIREGFLRDNIKRIASDVDETTKNYIFDIIEKGEELGWGFDEITDKITTVFNEFKKSRINNIVRSETIRAATQASIMAWEDAEVISGKERYTSQDERVCPHCAIMHEKKFGLNENFYKKGTTLETGLKLTYEDIQGPPLHASCRCTLLPIIED